MKKIFFLFLLIPGLVFADWQSTLESQFDIVETFDGLQDWIGGNYAGDITTIAAMPKKADGSASMWGYYADWDEGSLGVTWIDDFGSGTRIGATGKSLRLDISGGDRGPKRFGTYFGNGSPSSGYQSIYVFYRAFFPTGYFPSGLVYEKLSIVGHGHTSELGHPSPDNHVPYGIATFGPQIEYSGKQFRIRVADYCVDPAAYPYPDQKTTGVAVEGEWMSFEYHLTIDDVNEDSDEVEIWIYDDEGNASQVFTDNAVQLHNFDCSAGHRWNWFFLGGNDQSGGSMAYYVDDIIINDARIGPTYFEILENGVGEDTTPPAINVDPVIAVDGTTVPIPFSETVVTTGYDDGDFNLDCATSGTDIALNSITGTGSSRTFTTASTIHRGDTCNLDTGAGYSANEIEDVAGNDLVAITNQAVTNNSMANTAPTSTIDTPTENQTIGEGDTVNFTGTGADADSDDITYAWNFDGGASNSTSADPGNVQFNNAGIYDVTFTVTDEFGLADSTPDTVQVTVEAAALPGLPQCGIVSGPSATVGADKPQMSVGVE